MRRVIALGRRRADPDPAAARRPRLPQRPQGARLRELRLRPRARSSTQSNQLSHEFFDRLEDPPKGLTELQLEAEIATDRGTAEGLLQRVEGLDAPDELADAQDELVQAFELRRDGLAGIAEDIPTALGNEGRSEAIDRIVADMEAFLASDVLYERAQAEIQEVLDRARRSPARSPASQFLPEPVERWLDDLQLDARR